MITINRAQYLVLQWLISGDGDPLNAEWKTSARALERRKLVTISRKSGKYVASVTQEGERYLRDHAFPSDPKKSSQTQLPQEAQLVPERQVHRKRHPAVRSLSKYRGALPRDRDAQQRALEAADALINAVLDAGFDLKGHEQPSKYPINEAEPFTGCLFITIVAGHIELEITIGEQLKRIPHELTDKEKADQAKYRYFWARRYDFVCTGMSFFVSETAISPKIPRD